MRRLRQSPWLRELAAETRLHPSDLVWPLFVQEGANARTPIASMPGVARLSIDLLVAAAREARELDIPAVALFPVTEARLKTPRGEEALNADNLLCRAVRAVKDAVPEIGVITDVALDPYTTHGHDGVLNAAGTDVDNDATVEILCAQALLQARAGADVVAPSDMMDGRVGAIRRALEAEGFATTVILAYAAKYASALYGPFRDAVDSASQLGASGKHTYQMHPANTHEALREVALDLAEGADMVMVKPALPYLDIISRARETFHVPVFAYQVSGEYAMLHAAAAQGAFDYRRAMLETLLSIRRAGACGIFTYAAPDVARWLGNL
jgi:porphobilinogen synthase